MPRLYVKFVFGGLGALEGEGKAAGRVVERALGVRRGMPRLYIKFVFGG